MTGLFGRAADLLEFGPDTAPMCMYHQEACGLGAKPFDELYLSVRSLREELGQPVEPLDVHRAMTAEETAKYRRDFAEALATLQAENAATEARIRSEPPRPPAYADALPSTRNEEQE